MERDARSPASAGGRQEAAPPGCPQARPLIASRVEITPEVLGDFERIFDHLSQHDLENAPERIGAIIQTLDVVEANPLIGRPEANGMRELVIGRGSDGYAALYRYVDALDAVFVLAIRSQREAGYRRG